MSALSSLVENLKTTGLQIFEKIQETSLYQKLKERYESLPSSLQKTVLAAGLIALAALLMMIPLSTYWAGNETISSFEEKRGLIQDLFKVSTEGQVSLPVDPPPPIESLKSQIEMQLNKAQLTPDQQKGVSLDSVPSVFPKDLATGALSISLAKLNLRQIVDIGYQIQSISSGTKMVDLIIQANAQDSRYFDVIYRLITLNVPQFSVSSDSELAPPPPPSRRKKIQDEGEDE